MGVIPAEIQRITPYSLNILGPGPLLVHGKQCRGRFGRLSRAAMSVLAIFLTGGARAGIAQPLEVVVALVPVIPLNVHSCTGGDVHIHRFWVRKRHSFSI